MDLALPLALRAGLLTYCLLVPGWAMLRAAGFVAASRLDWLLACLAAGAASTSLTVTTLLLAGLYFRPVAILVLALPLAYLVWSYAKVRPESRVSPIADAALRVWPPDPVDRAVIVAAAGFLIVYLIDAWTSPITWWDGLASWGKWTADWGRRTSSAEYVVGGYPQLVPRIASVMYKLTGAHSSVLPLDFIALHGFYVLFAAWFLAAGVRLSRLVDMPAWPVVLAGLGSMQFREHIGAGTVDVLVAAMVATVLALYVGLRRGLWSASHESLVLGAAALAAIFTKWPGGVALILLVLLHRTSRLVWPVDPDRAASLGRTVRRSLAIAAVGMLPFVIEQGVSELRIARWRPQPFEMNISLREIPTLLATDANVVYRGGDARVRAGLVQLRFWNSYDVPPTLRVLFTGFLALCLIASAMTWFGRATLPVLVAYSSVWLFWSSYDQRNIFGLLPVLALCASFGAARLWQLRPSLVWKNAIALVAGLFLVLAGGSLLKDAQGRAVGLMRGERTFAARMAALRGGVGEKVTLFYPQFDRDYRFISALSTRTDAAHVLVTYPLYRFFERGAHALSWWPYELVEAGDVFAGHEHHTPPNDPNWVLVADHPPNRIWLRVSGLRPAMPRVVYLTASGGMRRLLYDVRPTDVAAAGLVVWRATLTGDARISPVIEKSDALQTDSILTSAVCVRLPQSPASQCSGVVALTPGSDGARSHRVGLAIGVETDADPARVTLTIATPLGPRGGQPQSPASAPETRASARR